MDSPHGVTGKAVQLGWISLAAMCLLVRQSVTFCCSHTAGAPHEAPGQSSSRIGWGDQVELIFCQVFRVRSRGPIQYEFQRVPIVQRPRTRPFQG